MNPFNGIERFVAVELKAPRFLTTRNPFNGIESYFLFIGGRG